VFPQGGVSAPILSLLFSSFFFFFFLKINK